jgi:hypothetical protein
MTCSKEVSNREIRGKDLGSKSSVEACGQEDGLALQYRPFPTDTLPEPLQSVVIDGSAAIGCDPSLIALPMLSVCGSALGNAVRLKAKVGWLVPPIVWTTVVSESGTGKTPAYRLALSPLQALQHRSFNQYVNEERDFVAQLKLGDGTQTRPNPQERPVCRRYLVSDTTLEALFSVLAENPNGLLMTADEISGWWGSFNKYSSGKGDQASWLSMFNAEPLTSDRKTGTQRMISVPKAAICIAGGIQPGILGKAMGTDNRESGMGARFLMAFPPRRPRRWSDAEVPQELEASYARAVERLAELRLVTSPLEYPEPYVLSLSSEAKQVYVEYFDQNGMEQIEFSGELAAAWSKLEEYPLRLALIFQLIDWANGPVGTPLPTEVDVKHVSDAIRLVEWFKNESCRINEMLSASLKDKQRERLISYTKKQGGTVSVRDLCRGIRPHPNSEEVRLMLQALVDSGDGKWSEVGTKGAERFTLNSIPVDVST